MRFGVIPSEGGRLFEQSLREVCYAEEREMTRRALVRAGQLEATHT